MDLCEHRRPGFFQRFCADLKNIPDFRFHKKAAGSGNLGSIGKGIKADHRHKGCDLFQISLIVALRFGGMRIDVDLFFEKSAPEIDALSVLQCKAALRAAGLAHVKRFQIRFRRLSLRPELFPVNEHVPEFGVSAFLHIIPKLAGADRDMVQHEIRGKEPLAGHSADVLIASESRIHFIVTDDRKAPVSRRGIERQDVKAPDFLREVSFQDLLQFLQVSSHAVRIGDQHAFVFNRFHSPFQFLRRSGQNRIAAKTRFSGF